jgi:hypothetical protein
VRYYACLRRRTRVAETLGVARCTMPDVKATALEAHAWAGVAATLLTGDNLSDGLRAEEERHAAEAARRDRQLQAIDAEIAKHRKHLRAIVERHLTSEPGSELDAMYAALAKEQDVAIAKLVAERDRRKATRLSGLSPAEAATLRQFATEVRTSIEAAGDVERRRIFELMRLRGEVRLDAEGVKLGHHHRFAVAWEALITIRDSDGGLRKTPTT